MGTKRRKKKNAPSAEQREAERLLRKVEALPATFRRLDTIGIGSLVAFAVMIGVCVAFDVDPGVPGYIVGAALLGALIWARIRVDLERRDATQAYTDAMKMLPPNEAKVLATKRSDDLLRLELEDGIELDEPLAPWLSHRDALQKLRPGNRIVVKLAPYLYKGSRRALIDWQATRDLLLESPIEEPLPSDVKTIALSCDNCGAPLKAGAERTVICTFCDTENVVVRT